MRMRRSASPVAYRAARTRRALIAVCLAALVLQGCRLITRLATTPTPLAPSPTAPWATARTPLPTWTPTATASSTPAPAMLMGPAGTIIAVQTRYYTPLLPVIEATPVSGSPVGTIQTRAPLLAAPTGTPAPEVPIHTSTPSATRTPTATHTSTATLTPTATASASPSATATP